MSEYHHTSLIVRVTHTLQQCHNDIYEYCHLNPNDVRASELNEEMNNLLTRVKALLNDRTPKELSSKYGFCPTCGGKGLTRERRIDGNDTCENGHTYPSRESKH